MFKKMIISAALACAFCSASSAMAAWPVWDEFRNDALDNGRVVDKSWISRVAEAIDIPFCVAGGIRTVEDAGRLLAYGADKISVNSPALADPDLISRLADRFGVQCVVVGIDSRHEEGSDEYRVNQFTGDEKKTRVTQWSTLDWVEEVQKRGAGEIVLNMMNQDGVRRGYDLRQLAAVRSVCRVPLIASGGAGPSTSSRPSETRRSTERLPPPSSTRRSSTSET